MEPSRDTMSRIVYLHVVTALFTNLNHHINHHLITALRHKKKEKESVQQTSPTADPISTKLGEMVAQSIQNDTGMQLQLQQGDISLVIGSDEDELGQFHCCLVSTEKSRTSVYFNSSISAECQKRIHLLSWRSHN